VTRYFASDPKELRLSVSAVVWRSAPGPANDEGAGPRQLLLMQRSDNAHWGLPGGYVEPGESVTNAAAREVLEETGVRVSVGRLVGVYSDPAMMVVEYAGGRRVHAVNLCFEAAPVGTGAATTPDETLATGYFALDALPEPLVPIHRVRIEDAAAGATTVQVR
jgi:ADP-ribose pyrophosphatase YjhB (NUDIX family)